MEYDYSLLKAEIIERSKAASWKEAKKEWIIDYYYDAEEKERCLCGDYPIKKCCVIQNLLNNNDAVIGADCARKFAEFTDVLSVFSSFCNVDNFINLSLSLMAINFAFDQDFMDEAEFNFYTDHFETCFDDLSEEQQQTRLNINTKVISKFYDKYPHKF